ncbi:MAG TPA: DUF11 domain-containing protein, partial [Gammaproteobacteria bacterium]|nr:DUF11 domain-containing protein [Gammaproteobacteria bacterium]
SWSKLKEFDDPTAAASDLFSYAGAISGDGETFLASAIQQTVNGTPDAGEVYVYQSPVDLALTMEAGQSSVITGRQVALELTATNTDSVVTANNVVLTITLASGLSYVSSDAANGTCTHVGSTVTCKLASLVPGETWQPSVMTLASSTGTLKSHASISSNQPDPVSGNDSASASINVSTPSNSGGGGSTPPSGSGGGDVDFWTLGLLVGLLAVRTKRVKVQAMEQI